MPPRCSFHEGFTSPRPLGASPNSARSLSAAASGTYSGSTSTSPTPPPPAPAPSPNKYGKVAAGGGKYGQLKKSVSTKEAATGPAPSAVPKIYPKSANFAQTNERESRKADMGLDSDDEAVVPQSARAATSSWSASGGTREATFKKRPNSSANFSNEREHASSSSAIGFAIVLNAADSSSLRAGSRGSLDDDDDDPAVVGLVLEQLICKLEIQVTGNARGVTFDGSPRSAHAAGHLAASPAPSMAFHGG